MLEDLLLSMGTAQRAYSCMNRAYLVLSKESADILTRLLFVYYSAHSLDQGVSTGSAFNNAIASSSCVPDAYADTSNVEVHVHSVEPSSIVFLTPILLH